MSEELTPRHTWAGTGGVCKLFVPERKTIDAEARTIDLIVSTATRDRDGDIVEPMGWKLGKYRKNPVVLWAHDYGQPPVGRAQKIAVEGGALRATAKFAAEEYDFAATLFRLYQGGFLNAFSAGFMPRKAEPDGEGYRFSEQELWEFSAVPVPSNPDALVAARSARIAIDPVVDAIETALDERRWPERREVMHGAYISIKGTVHPVVSGDLAARNIEALEAKDGRNDDSSSPDDAAERAAGDAKQSDNTGDLESRAAAGDEFTTGAGGDPEHTHTFALGDTVTSEEDGHVHAVLYSDEGQAIIEDAEGHGHEAPSEARMDGQEDDPEERGITNFPEPGDDMPVAWAHSNYRRFPLAEAKALALDWPEILAAEPDPDIAEREVNAPSLIGGDVIECVRSLVIHERGLDWMREEISRLKMDARDERDRKKGLLRIVAKPEPATLNPDKIREILPGMVKDAVAARIAELSGRAS